MRPDGARNEPVRDQILLISDLHLSPRRPETVQLFLDFLTHRAAGAGALYILGDLFDAWIGDDDDAPPAPAVIAALRRLADAGTALYLQHGNRDFLLGRRFARASGCTLLPDPVVQDLHGRPTLLMHGDLLCSDDLAYQRFRRQVHNPWRRGAFLLLPLRLRRRIAARYRRRSGAATAAKPAAIMDVNQATVADYLTRHGVRRLIHGHTHRPGRQLIPLADGSEAERWVLADWQPQLGQVLCCTPAGQYSEPVTPHSPPPS
jgi:UDP-2,3-diacylglucosamine hydrolase